MPDLKEVKRMLGLVKELLELPHPLILDIRIALDYTIEVLALLENTEEVPHCTLSYGDGWAFCSNCKGEWVVRPRELDDYKYCPVCGAKVVLAEELEKEGEL